MENFLQQCPDNADAPKGFKFSSSHFLNINVFLSTLSTILLSIMITMLSTRNTMKLLIGCTNSNWSIDRSRKRLVDFYADQVRLVSFNCSNSSVEKSLVSFKFLLSAFVLYLAWNTIAMSGLALLYNS